jgi:hypothetical protein
MRRPVPLRLKVAIAGLAGLGLAWLIPRGGGVPESSPTPTLSPTDRPGVTALEVPLNLVPQGISYHPVGDVRVFLARSGNTITGFVGTSTASGNGPVWWCPKNTSFQDVDGDVRYDAVGGAMLGTAPRDLDRVRVLVAAGRVTIFPESVTGGATASPSSGAPRFPAPCSAAERVG